MLLTDHHIRIAFIVAVQSFFLLAYLAVISDGISTLKKKEYIASVARIVMLLFIFSANAYFVKDLIEIDRESTREEEAHAIMEKQIILEKNISRKEKELFIRKWHAAKKENDAQEYDNYVKEAIDQIKKNRELIKKTQRDIKRFKHISTPATLVPPTFRAKNPDSSKHQEYLPLFNTHVK